MMGTKALPCSAMIWSDLLLSEMVLFKMVFEHTTEGVENTIRYCFQGSLFGCFYFHRKDVGYWMYFLLGWQISHYLLTNQSDYLHTPSVQILLIL